MFRVELKSFRMMLSFCSFCKKFEIFNIVLKQIFDFLQNATERRDDSCVVLILTQV